MGDHHALDLLYAIVDLGDSVVAYADLGDLIPFMDGLFSRLWPE